MSSRDLFVQVDFKCGKVDGKLVCGSTKANQNRVDDDDDDDDRPKGKGTIALIFHFQTPFAELFGLCFCFGLFFAGYL
jgi:hypothetical protein